MRSLTHYGHASEEPGEENEYIPDIPTRYLKITKTSGELPDGKILTLRPDQGENPIYFRLTGPKLRSVIMAEVLADDPNLHNLG